MLILTSNSTPVNPNVRRFVGSGTGNRASGILLMVHVLLLLVHEVFCVKLTQWFFLDENVGTPPSDNTQI